MGRRQRRRGRGSGGGSAAPGPKVRPDLVPWRERMRELLGRLRDFARDRRGPEIEEYLHARLGDDAADADVTDLQRAFDEYVCTPGSADEGRSLLRAFVEESQDLTAEEREQLPRWEMDRTRRVYLLDRAHRDRLELWDPVEGGRVVLQLIDKMEAGRVAALARGTLVVAHSVPFGARRIALGGVEMYDEGEALDLYRKEVRSSGRTWRDLPPLTPV